MQMESEIVVSNQEGHSIQELIEMAEQYIQTATDIEEMRLGLGDLLSATQRLTRENNDLAEKVHQIKDEIRINSMGMYDFIQHFAREYWQYMKERLMDGEEDIFNEYNTIKETEYAWNSLADYFKKKGIKWSCWGPDGQRIENEHYEYYRLVEEYRAKYFCPEGDQSKRVKPLGKM